MKCVNCGRENNDNSNFCFYCGYAFREEKTDTAAENRQRIIINEEPEDFYEGNMAFGSTPTLRKVQQTTDRQTGREVSGTVRVVGWIIYFASMIIPFTMPIWLLATLRLAFSADVKGEEKYIARALLILVMFVVAAVLVYMAVTIA